MEQSAHAAIWMTTFVQDDIKLVVHRCTAEWPRWNEHNRRGIVATLTTPLDVDAAKALTEGMWVILDRLYGYNLHIKWIYYEHPSSRPPLTNTVESLASIAVNMYHKDDGRVCASYTLCKEGLPECSDPMYTISLHLKSLTSSLGEERVERLLKACSTDYCLYALLLEKASRLEKKLFADS